MVTNVDDVVEEISPLAGAASAGRANRESVPLSGRWREAPPERARIAPEVKFSLEEATLLREIPEEGTTIDALARISGYAASRVNALLVGLRLKGRIRFLPGNRVALSKKI